MAEQTLVDYVKARLKEGYTPDVLRSALAGHYPQEEIAAALAGEPKKSHKALWISLAAIVLVIAGTFATMSYFDDELIQDNEAVLTDRITKEKTYEQEILPEEIIPQEPLLSEELLPEQEIYVPEELLPEQETPNSDQLPENDLGEFPEEPNVDIDF